MFLLNNFNELETQMNVVIFRRPFLANENPPCHLPWHQWRPLLTFLEPLIIRKKGRGFFDYQNEQEMGGNGALCWWENKCNRLIVE